MGTNLVSRLVFIAFLAKHKMPERQMIMRAALVSTTFRHFSLG
jgi:hypothetical protein